MIHPGTLFSPGTLFNSNISFPPSPRELLSKLPEKALKPASLLPFSMQSILLEKVLYLAFKAPLEAGELDFLQQKWLKIDITDLGILLFFSCGPRQQILISKRAKSDVCIRGNLKSFVLLAAQKEDPDTLFFQRDLVIEGDTDLGLQIKNLLDSLEVEQLPPELIFTLRTSAEYMTIFVE